MDGGPLPAAPAPFTDAELETLSHAGRASCEQGCVTQFGATLGEHEGVKAYSNCQASCIHDQYSWMNLMTKQVSIHSGAPKQEGLRYVGLVYQCVEYARRWWMHHLGVTFGDVDSAADIMSLSHYIDLRSDVQERPLGRSVNGEARRAPQRGDLLIYQARRASPSWRFGHVAVVVGVSLEAGYIEVAEQNLTNAPWAAPERYARRLQLTQLSEGRYQVLDVTPGEVADERSGEVLGWVYPLP